MSDKLKLGDTYTHEGVDYLIAEAEDKSWPCNSCEIDLCPGNGKCPFGNEFGLTLKRKTQSQTVPALIASGESLKAGIEKLLNDFERETGRKASIMQVPLTNEIRVHMRVAG